MACKLLSIDSSSSSTGYSIFEDGEYSRHGLINLKSVKDSEERVRKMIAEIYELIELEKPKIIVTEMTTVTRNAQAQRTLTMVLGAILGKCVEEGIFYYSFRPTEWRALISKEKKPRKREELKLWSIQTVNELYDIHDANDDESDAILIGQAYVNKFS